MAAATLPRAPAIPSATLTWVTSFLRAGSSLPAESLERTAAALCRSLAPGTLADYRRFALHMEELTGQPLVRLVATTDAGLHLLV